MISNQAIQEFLKTAISVIIPGGIRYLSATEEFKPASAISTKHQTVHTKLVNHWLLVTMYY